MLSSDFVGVGAYEAFFEEPLLALWEAEGGLFFNPLLNHIKLYIGLILEFLLPQFLELLLHAVVSDRSLAEDLRHVLEQIQHLHLVQAGPDRLLLISQHLELYEAANLELLEIVLQCFHFWLEE